MTRAFPFSTRDGKDGIVREARDRDARACLRMVGEAAAERPRTLAVQEEELWSVREWRRNRIGWGERGASLVATVEGEVVGQLGVTRGPREITKHSAQFGITVAARARGVGVGRALIEVAERWASENGVTRISLGVFSGNERARGLYRSMGYVDEGVENAGMRFPEGTVDVVRMYKMLGADQRDYDERSTLNKNGSKTEG